MLRQSEHCFTFVCGQGDRSSIVDCEHQRFHTLRDILEVGASVQDLLLDRGRMEEHAQWIDAVEVCLPEPENIDGRRMQALEVVVDAEAEEKTRSIGVELVVCFLDDAWAWFPTFII